MHNLTYISLLFSSQNMIQFYMNHKIQSHHVFVLACLAIIFSLLLVVVVQ